MKSKTLKLAKAKARRYFKSYIRLRDAYATTGTPFSCICCTCGKEIPFGNKLHAGHFLAGSSNSVFFEESNCHGQCMYCNTYLHGALDKYLVFMINKYGQEEVDRLYALKGKTIKYTIGEYDYISEVYKEKIKLLNQ